MSEEHREKTAQNSGESSVKTRRKSKESRTDGCFYIPLEDLLLLLDLDLDLLVDREVVQEDHQKPDEVKEPVDQDITKGTLLGRQCDHVWFRQSKINPESRFTPHSVRHLIQKVSEEQVSRGES